MDSIWCDDCAKVQPLVVDFLPASDLNDHAAQDLVCGECHFIIATLHETLNVSRVLEPEEEDAGLEGFRAIDEPERDIRGMSDEQYWDAMADAQSY